MKLSWMKQELRTKYLWEATVCKTEDKIKTDINEIICEGVSSIERTYIECS